MRPGFYFLLLMFITTYSNITFSQVPPPSSHDLKIDVNQGPNPWTSLELNNTPDKFQFAIVTDRTGGHRKGIFEDAIEKLNLLQPEFVMSVGDFIEGYTEDTTELNTQWDEFEGFIDNLSMPFFYLPGNHDFSNDVMEDIWRQRFGKDYYHFVYNDVLFLCLNSEDGKNGTGRGTITDVQFEYIKKALASNQDVNWTLVFMHQPLWTQHNGKNWKEVEKLLAQRQHTVFAGHHHRYVKYPDYNNGDYFVLATTGGGSRLRGADFGEFDHVVWVTMTEKGPILANLFLEGIWNENVVTLEKHAFIERISNKQAIAIEPVIVMGDSFKKGKAKLKFTNDENVPMTVYLKEGFSWDLNGRFEKNTFTVPPNSVEFVDLQLSAKNRKSLSLIKPLNVQVELSYAFDSFSGIKIPFHFKLKPVSKIKINSVENPVCVDGNLEEWPELSASFSVSNPNDLNVQFEIARDNKFLFLAARVVDDKLMLENQKGWNKDNINWLVNASSTNKSAINKGEGNISESIVIRLSPESQQQPLCVFQKENLPEGTKYSCKRNKKGYEMEAAIPIAFMKNLQGKDWESVRVNLFIDDMDAKGEKTRRVWLYPDWRGKNNYIGSGLFFK
ncbi:MAG: hypothetical protein GY705_24395 [Bacteroidetes bacterium]|nr:hypothetical protein [Bacteroidota bacterium]